MVSEWTNFSGHYLLNVLNEHMNAFKSVRRKRSSDVFWQVRNLWATLSQSFMQLIELLVDFHVNQRKIRKGSSTGRQWIFTCLLFCLSSYVRLKIPESRIINLPFHHYLFAGSHFFFSLVFTRWRKLSRTLLPSSEKSLQQNKNQESSLISSFFACV